jgi:hypothetical protein
LNCLALLEAGFVAAGIGAVHAHILRHPLPEGKNVAIVIASARFT